MSDKEKRQHVPIGHPMAEMYGYSRAVRVGNIVEVAGSGSYDENGPVGIDDPYAQAKSILARIERALHEVGASLEDVIKTRAYVVDMSRWEEVARAHVEFFGDIKPAATLVGVTALVDETMLVEIEATAVVG